jgi:hypothetical protein
VEAVPVDERAVDKSVAGESVAGDSVVGEERKPAKVGKSGAQGESDDIR